MVATSLVAGLILSWWVVPPYLALVGWLLLAPGERCREDASEISNAPENGFDLVVTADESPTGHDAASPTDEPKPAKPRQGRGRSKSRATPDPSPRTIEVRWVQVGPGKYVRAEMPVPPESGAFQGVTEPLSPVERFDEPPQPGAQPGELAPSAPELRDAADISRDAPHSPGANLPTNIPADPAGVSSDPRRAVARDSAPEVSSEADRSGTELLSPTSLHHGLDAVHSERGTSIKTEAVEKPTEMTASEPGSRASQGDAIAVRRTTNIRTPDASAPEASPDHLEEHQEPRVAGDVAATASIRPQLPAQPTETEERDDDLFGELSPASRFELRVAGIAPDIVGFARLGLHFRAATELARRQDRRRPRAGRGRISPANRRFAPAPRLTSSWRSRSRSRPWGSRSDSYRQRHAHPQRAPPSAQPGVLRGSPFETAVHSIQVRLGGDRKMVVVGRGEGDRLAGPNDSGEVRGRSGVGPRPCPV